MSCLPFRELRHRGGRGRRYYHRALLWPPCCAVSGKGPAAPGRRRTGRSVRGARHRGGAVADVSPVVIRPLTEADLADADRVFRVAFGTFLGVPEPRQFFGDAEFVRTRWRSGNDAAFAAVREDRLVGSNFGTNWGSVGFFGPLT